ncbi:MAG: RHS repeat-associated core domain-containing protein [Opitutaceae bacterium]|nr:RHS repeat-associated core domain-containing protein [Opitutaceae bacterium]
MTDALGQIARFGYDHAGRLTTTTDPLNQVVSRTYDAAGRNDSLRNARGKTWLFGFTATGQPETLTTPLSRLTDTDFNALGQPTTVTEPSLQSTAFTYFDDARPHTSTDALGTITSSYDANGRLETVVEGGKTITRHYNALGQLDTFTDGAGNPIAYKNDGAGNLVELTYPGTPVRKVTYTYDSVDRLETVTDWAARVTRFRYDTKSRLARIELPNGTQRVFSYDGAGRVSAVRDEVVANGLLVSGFSLGYDALDRIVEETTQPEPVQFAITTASMSYDDDDRLTGWNALVTQSDADGNLTKGPLGGALATFVYDVRNRLTSVGTSSYSYDAENRRTSRTVGGVTTTFVHDPNAALSRLLQSTTSGTATRYVYAGSLLLYAETGAALRVHHYDYRGSTVALTDTTGTILGRVTYGSYGEIVARTGNTSTEFLYNGRDGVITDPNGLYHMRARYYSPETRRFLNADPIGFGGGNNWYAYVGGAPVMFADPRGLAASSSEDQTKTMVLIVQSDVSISVGMVADGVRVTAGDLIVWTKDSVNKAVGSAVVSIDEKGFRTEGQYLAAVEAGIGTHYYVWTISHGVGDGMVDAGNSAGAIAWQDVVGHVLQSYPDLRPSDVLSRYRALMCTSNEQGWVFTDLREIIDRVRAAYGMGPVTEEELDAYLSGKRKDCSK